MYSKQVPFGKLQFDLGDPVALVLEQFDGKMFGKFRICPAL